MDTWTKPCGLVGTNFDPYKISAPNQLGPSATKLSARETHFQERRLEAMGDSGSPSSAAFEGDIAGDPPRF